MPAAIDYRRRTRNWKRRERRERAAKRQQGGAPDPECIHCEEPGHYVWHCPAGNKLLPEGEASAADEAEDIDAQRDASPWKRNPLDYTSGTEDSDSEDEGPGMKVEMTEVKSDIEETTSEAEGGSTELPSDSDSEYEDAQEEREVEDEELSIGETNSGIGSLQI
jgi:hypothetical protein